MTDAEATLVSAAVSAVVAIVTSVIVVRVQHTTFREQMKQENQRHEKEMAHLTQQHREELEAENTRFEQQRRDALREQLRQLVSLLDRGLFHAGLDREDPAEMLSAIIDVRQKLQSSGARVVRDDASAEAFSRIRDALYAMEIRVEARFPNLVRLVRDRRGSEVTREETQQALGTDYWPAIQVMMALRDEVRAPMEVLHQRLRELG